MLIPHPKKSLGILFFLLILSIPFALAYYNSEDSQLNALESFSEQYSSTSAADTDTANHPMAHDTIYLKKDEKHLNDYTGIVFKGISKGKISLDLYILDLDPDVPYPLNFTVESVRDGIWLNNVQYRLVSVKENLLCLKIQDAYRTL